MNNIIKTTLLLLLPLTAITPFTLQASSFDFELFAINCIEQFKKLYIFARQK